MTPAYPGRSLTFIWDGNTIQAEWSILSSEL